MDGFSIVVFTFNALQVLQDRHRFSLMSFPRRQTTPYSRTWTYSRPTGTLLVVCMLTGWGAAQALMWAMDLTDMRNGLVLNQMGMVAGEYWRFLTFQLAHADLLHFLITMTVLLLAGREVEPVVGRRQLLGLFLVANLVGGATAYALQPQEGVLGASSAAAAVLAAYATIFPEMELRGKLFYAIPVCFYPKHLVILTVTLAACALGFGWAGEVGPAGILVGTGLGWLWARSFGFGRPFWFQRAAEERRVTERRQERMTSEEFIACEVDPILEKIARTGMRSLTRAERRVLERAKAKMETKGT